MSVGKQWYIDGENINFTIVWDKLENNRLEIVSCQYNPPELNDKMYYGSVDVGEIIGVYDEDSNSFEFTRYEFTFESCHEGGRSWELAVREFLKSDEKFNAVKHFVERQVYLNLPDLLMNLGDRHDDVCRENRRLREKINQVSLVITA